ncbi:MAG: PilZ domain-containing protein [Fibromonadales bacterium]|nr:PilZ domain-containing protein [Fibromonadales bacterium]
MPIGSKILIHTNDAVESERLVRLLMYQRFVPKAVESISYATLALVSGEYPIFLCTYTPDDKPVLDFLSFMRQDNQMRSVTPIVIMSKPTQECITNLIKVGCSNFVLQSAGQQVLINKMEAIAESIGDVRDKRQFARVEIPEYENAQILITARNGNKYPVRISNISMGGLLLTWSPEKIPVQRMVTGDVLMNCLLIAKSLDLYVDVRIINVFNYKAGVQFVGLNEERQGKLCNFIYERLLAENVPDGIVTDH